MSPETPNNLGARRARQWERVIDIGDPEQGLETWAEEVLIRNGLEEETEATRHVAACGCVVESLKETKLCHLCRDDRKPCYWHCGTVVCPVCGRNVCRRHFNARSMQCAGCFNAMVGAAIKVTVVGGLVLLVLIIIANC